VEEEIRPRVDDWIERGEQYDLGLHKRAHELGISGVLFPGEFGGSEEQHDFFHRVILWDELARCGGGMAFAGLSVTSMALPPILFAGSEELKRRVAPALVRGEKLISLCISEPHAGSDVMNLQATATKSADGRSYVLNGVKKWISGGAQASFFTVAARTGEPGVMGLSLFLVEAERAGVAVRKMKTQFDSTHSTALVTLEDVVVPAENLIGDENAGFFYIVQNLNKERHTIAVSGLRCARTCYEETLRWAMTRETWGQKLVAHQLVRFKLAEMLRQIEQLQDHVERVAFQFASGTPDVDMAVDCSLLKVNASTIFEYCAKEASTIFGGSSLMREGQGKTVERLFREVNAIKIPGGAPDVLLDFAMREVQRQAVKAEKKRLERERASGAGAGAAPPPKM